MKGRRALQKQIFERSAGTRVQLAGQRLAGRLVCVMKDTHTRQDEQLLIDKMNSWRVDSPVCSIASTLRPLLPVPARCCRLLPVPRLPSQSHARLPSQSHARLPSQSDARLPSRSHARLPSRSDARLPSQSDARLPSQSHARLPCQSDARLPSQSHARRPMRVCWVQSDAPLARQADS